MDWSKKALDGKGPIRMLLSFLALDLNTFGQYDSRPSHCLTKLRSKRQEGGHPHILTIQNLITKAFPPPMQIQETTMRDSMLALSESPPTKNPITQYPYYQSENVPTALKVTNVCACARKGSGIKNLC
jgi:hypothetical protein